MGELKPLHRADVASTACQAGSATAWSATERRAAFSRYALLDLQPGLDNLVRLACDVWEAPIAFISLVDEERQWLKAKIGIDACEMPRHAAFDQAFKQQSVFIVPDARTDPRFADQPLLSDAPEVCFCAAARLATPEGLPLGMLCVADVSPRPHGLEARQLRMLTQLAAQAMIQLEQQRVVAERQQQIKVLGESEERLRLALDGAGVGLWDWDLVNGRGWWSPRLAALFGSETNENITYEQRYAMVHPDDRERIAAEIYASLQADTDLSIEYRILRPDNEVRWVASRGVATARVDGRAVRTTGLVFDITDRKTAEDALRESERHMRVVLDSVSDGFYALDGDWRFILFNRAAEAFFGLSRDDVMGRTFLDVFPQIKGSVFERRYRMVMEQGQATIFEAESVIRTGCPIEVRASPKEGGGIAVSFSDISHRRRAEDRQRLLINELNHRVKNTLAVVQSIAHQSFRSDTDPAARRAFEGRLMALSAAHNLLTRENWEGVGLSELVGTATRPFRTTGMTRIIAEGDDLRLAPKTAVSLALALHELSTNAVKYGALSNDSGRVSISWRVDDAAKRLCLRWVETGGPPAGMPECRGFGSRMIERGLPAELSGQVRLDFRPEGVVCEIDAALPAINM